MRNEKGQFVEGHSYRFRTKIEKQIYICKTCNKKFLDFPYKQRIYCSKHCVGMDRIWNRGLTKNIDPRVKKMAEKKKGLGNGMFGRRNYNFKGLSPLNIYIRQCSLMTEWKQKVFEKSNYACAHCGDKRGGNFNAHHKVSFKKLMEEFLDTFNQFSPVEDLETLIRLSYNHKPFWNVDNGICFCEDCHKEVHRKASNGVQS